MATIKKAQMGKDVPKDKAKTEMGKLVDRKSFLKGQDKMADALDKQAGKGKYAPKPKSKAKSGKSIKMVVVKKKK
jgi:hypothetical protein